MDTLHGRLWVAYHPNKAVQAIDPVKGVLVGEPIAVGGYPVALKFDGSRLWILNGESASGNSTVQWIDPATQVVGTPIQVNMSFRQGPNALVPCFKNNPTV